MELIYSMRRKPLKFEPPEMENPLDPEVVRPICTISSANIVAFTSLTELNDVDGDTWGGHVYVCDLDTPWDSHKVTSTAFPVSALEWDNEGKQLLVATTAGEVFVYGQKEYLLNEWTCLYSANLPGEHIIKAVFFHNGRRVVVGDKKPDAPIAEKFQMLRSTPTLKGFGGVACEGVALITATGLVGAITPPTGDSTKALVVTESLRPTRDYVTAAAIAHKNGKLMVAGVCRTSSGWCVRAHAVCVHAAHTHTPAHTHLTTQPLPALYLPESEGSTAPVSIAWCLLEDTDSLLVAGSNLTMWKLAERSHPVHKLLSKGPLQGSTTPGGGQKATGDCFNTLVWQQAGAWTVDGGSVMVTGGVLSLSPPHAILLTTNTVHLLSRETLHFICSLPLGGVRSTGAGSPPKKHKYGPGSSSGSGVGVASWACVSWLGGVVAVVDASAQLHVYRLPLWPDNASSVAQTTHACTFLEYAMLTGIDCLDVLLNLKTNLVEPVYERLTETFQRQPPSFQQYYYHTWFKLRMALCRSAHSLASSASWLTSVSAALGAFAAASASLRTDELLPLLDDHHHDHDKTLAALESKPESYGEGSALLALARPLQRARLTAAAALASLAHHTQHHSQHHGYEVWADPTAVSVLRRLVVLARAGGRGGEALSRALARLAALGPKHDMQEELSAAAAAGPAGRVWDCPPRAAVSAPHGAATPHHLDYGIEPEALRYAPEPTFSYWDATPAPAMDSIRYMYLGGGGVGGGGAGWVRACGRCGARALPPARAPRHLRPHDARYAPACRCGGKWTLFSNVL